jgi:hypothetical protein
MSRLCVGGNPGLLQPSSVVVEALLHVAKIDAFRDTWMPIDDFASIIHASFNLTRTTKDILTGLVVNRRISKDALTKECVDSRHNNMTGIFRDFRYNGKKKVHYLCLCNPGSTPSPPPDGKQWFVDIRTLPPNWNPERGAMGTAMTTVDYERIQVALTEFLRPMIVQDRKRPKKSVPPNASDVSSKRPKTALSTSSVTIQNPDGSTVVFEVQPQFAKEITDMIIKLTEQQDICVLTEKVIETQTAINRNEVTRTAETCMAISEPISVDDGTDATDNVPAQNVSIVSGEKERNNKVTDRLVTVNGNLHKVKGVPAAFELIHKTRHSVLKKKGLELAKVKKCLDRGKFQGTELAKRIYAAAIVLTPGLSLTGAETLIPMVIAAFMADTQGSLDLSELPKMTNSFPSGSSLREFLYLYAIDCLLELSENLEKADCVYLACDKGNKKGLGHFVKVLSWWDKKAGKVQMFTLDVDASEGMTADCAQAIQHSLKKVNGILEALLLSGTTTDSGGGGVLEKLAEELNLRDLCKEGNVFQIANCTLHAIQLALSNPVKIAFLEGSLGSRSMMQALHSVYDLQQSMEYDHFKSYMKTAQQWVGQNILNKKETHPPKDDFEKDWYQLLRFTGDLVDDTLSITVVPAPVLTRWWYVGVAAEFLILHFHTVFRACQLICNDHDTKSRPNIIASALYSQMMEPQIFSDLVFLRTFHQEFLVEHFDWLQELDNQSQQSGFRSHQILVRYFFMKKDLEQLDKDINQDGRLVQWKDTLNTLTLPQEEEQWRKVRLFLKESKKSLKKHFDRWATDLMPHGLGSDHVTAQIIAKKLLQLTNGHNTQPVEGANKWVYLPGHDRVVQTCEFAEFLEENCKTVPKMNQTYLDIAKVVGSGTDLWNPSEDTPEMVFLRNQFCAMTLPLASNTHMAERAVKECKIVSATGKKEELRSVMSICRSALLSELTGLDGKEKAKKALHVVCEHHKRMSARPKTNDNVRRKEDIKFLLKEDHFKKKRIEKKQAKMLQQTRNKKKNVAQKKTGVDQTDAILGLVRFGKIRMNIYVASIDQELDFREISRMVADGSGVLKEGNVTQKLALLRAHEATRTKRQLKDVDSFEPLSGAVFNVLEA